MCRDFSQARKKKEAHCCLGQRGQPLILTHGKREERRTEVKEKSDRKDMRSEHPGTLGFQTHPIVYGSLEQIVGWPSISWVACLLAIER
jgi:hypothetical protein